MRIKKYLIVFLAVIFLSGCNVNYNVDIKSNNEIVEDVTIELNKSEENYESLSNLVQIYKINDRNYKLVKKDKKIVFNYNNKYNNIEDYTLNSPVYKQLTDDISLNKSKNYTRITSTIDLHGLNNSINTDNNNYIDYLKININSSLPVIYSNCDKSSNNIYTWSFNKNSKIKDIDIKFNNTPISVSYKTLIVGFMIILSVILLVNFYKKLFKNNQNLK